MSKSNAQRGKEFRERKKKKEKEKLAASPVEKVTKKPQKNSANSSSTTAKWPSEFMREYQARKKNQCKILLMPSLRDGNAIETLLMTSQINTDFVNQPVPLTTEPTTNLVRVGTDACKSIINSLTLQRLIPIKRLTKIFKGDSLIILSVTGVQFITDYGLEMI
ncbi:uncharacterized protein TNCV_2376971 [Trichonephila clavipes]|nr:uncharacterized protein TNCV_2376971 [Trichonephila clavipes]